MKFQSEQQVQEYLLELHRRMGGWRQVALLPEFYGWIRFGSLNKIARTGKIQNPEFRLRFGLPSHNTCGMCNVFLKYAPKVRNKRKRWDQYPLRVIRNSIAHREEF